MTAPEPKQGIRAFTDDWDGLLSVFDIQERGLNSEAARYALAYVESTSGEHRARSPAANMAAKVVVYLRNEVKERMRAASNRVGSPTAQPAPYCAHPPSQARRARLSCKGRDRPLAGNRRK